MKCPCCGYDFKKKANPSLDIIRLMQKRSKKCQNSLNYICNIIEAEILSEDDINKRFKFLQGISISDEEAIRISIAKYTINNMYKRGYGYAYLRSMILKEYKDGPVKRNNELKRYGKPPSKRKNNDDI